MRGAVALSTDDRPTSSKKVCWETLEKLCQVRLFAAEDAPLLSGTTLQDLFQAKETKFLHVVKPVSEIDLPPGFVSFAAKPTGVGADTNVSMDSQVHWRVPEKFLYNSGWQVSAGDGSTAVLTEQKRELGASEAMFTSDTPPPSPEELQETSAEIDNHIVPVIPIFCIEDDDEMEEDCSPGTSAFEPSNNGTKLKMDTSPRKGSERNELGEKHGGLFSDSAWQAYQSDRERSAASLADADPNVAAAAAAAYAVLKAKEQANQNLPNQPRDFLRAISDEPLKGRNKNEFATGRVINNAVRSVGSNAFPLPVQLGCKATVSTVENRVNEASTNQSWNTFGHHENAKPFSSPRVDPLFSGRTELLGQGVGVTPSLANRQDLLKDLIQQHGIEKNRIEGPLRSFTEMEIIGNNKLVPGAEMLRSPVLGSFPQLSVGNQVVTSSHGRNDGFPQGRYGGEVSQSRFQKPCLYFNTPKGCRRGTSCFYLHDAAPEQPYTEQARSEFFQFQQSKRPKFGVPDKD